MSILNKLSVFLEASRKNTKQFGDSVPDSKAMQKYAHKRYVDVNKDWIPKKQLANESTEFDSWFKNSKVVDAAGKPLIVYHATNKKFDEFKKGKSVNFNNAQRLIGFFFAEDKGYARQYGDIIMPVYLSISNPYKTTSDRIDRLENASDRNATKFVRRLKDNGYDGIKFGSGKIAEWVAFYPNQIKSVDNTGTWNKNSNSIYETRQLADEENSNQLIKAGKVVMPTGAIITFRKYSGINYTIDRIEVPEKLRGTGLVKKSLLAITKEADSRGIALGMSISPDIKSDELTDSLVRISKEVGFKSEKIDGETYRLDRVRKSNQNKNLPM